MANYAALKATIDADIRSNGEQLITGPVLNGVLTNILAVMGQAGFLFKGMAHPGDTPAASDSNLFYLAVEAGQYSGFDGRTVTAGQLVIFAWDGAWASDVLLDISGKANKNGDPAEAFTVFTLTAISNIVGAAVTGETVGADKVILHNPDNNAMTDLVPGGQSEDIEVATPRRSGTLALQEDVDAAVSQLGQEADDLTEVQDALIQKNIVNLLDPTQFSNGYISSGGALTEHVNYKTSDYIPVVAGKRYTFIKTGSTWYGTQHTLIPGYDSTKTYTGTAQCAVTGTYGSYPETTLAIYTTNPIPEGISYIRFSFQVTVKDVNMCVLGTTFPSQYIPYGGNPLDLTPYAKGLVKEAAGEYSILEGKSLSVTGDSICYGAGYTGGYAKIIADRNSMQLSNIAVSGGTIVNQTGHFCIGESIANMPISDYNLLEGGVNDASLSVALGSLTNSYNPTFDTSTFYGAFESMLQSAIVKFKGKKLGYIMTHGIILKFSPFWTADNGFYNAVVKCCTKWGVPMLDLSKEVPPFALLKQSTATSGLADDYTLNGDGWHPNEDGYKKYYCDRIEAWMKTL